VQTFRLDIEAEARWSSAKGLCRVHGFNHATFFIGFPVCGGMRDSKAKRLNESGVSAARFKQALYVLICCSIAQGMAGEFEEKIFQGRARHL